MAAGDGAVLTLAAARVHLRLGDEASDDEVGEAIAAAEAAIADELGRALIAETRWATVDAVPPNVVQAIKLALTVLWDDRTAALPRTAILSLIGRWVVVSFG